MLAIFKREFKTYFTTPLGYIVLAAIFFFLGLNFSMVYSMGAPNVEVVIVSMSTVTVFVMPVITMRLMSEDRRQKVDQALLTAPVSLTAIVLGKFFAAFALFTCGFLPTVIFELIVLSYVSVNILSYLYALLGVLLLGSALIAIGMFISSLTESSVVAAVVTLIVNILVLYMSSFKSMISVEWIAKIFEKAAFVSIFESFAEAIFSIPNIIYLLSIAAAFLFLCVRSLEKKRWS